jgi:transposase
MAEAQSEHLASIELTQWARGAYNLTRPLVKALARHVLAAGKLHAEDTPFFKVLAPGTGSTKKGRLELNGDNA